MNNVRQIVTFEVDKKPKRLHLTVDRNKIIAVQDTGFSSSIIFLVGSESFTVAEDYETVIDRVFC